MLSWYGGKERLAKWIVSLLPPTAKRQHYAEPFSGMASVLRARPRVNLESLVDLDAELINFYLSVQREADRLADRVVEEFPPRARSLLLEMHEWLASNPPPAWPDHDVDRALHWIHLRLLSICLPGRVPRLAVRYRRSAGASAVGVANRLRAGAERLQGVQILRMDGLDLLERIRTEAHAVVYLDPPYLGHEHEYGSKVDRDRMLALLTDPGARAAIAVYGGKTRLSRWIASLLPLGNHYVEPFAGMASVLLARDRARVETLSDTDADLVNWWLTAQRETERLALAASADLPPRSAKLLRDMLAWLRESAPPAWPDHDGERASVWMQTRLLARGAVAPSSTSTSFSRTYGKASRMKPETVAQRIRAIADRIRNVQILTDPAEVLVRKCGGARKSVLYLDPPYRGHEHEYVGVFDRDLLLQGMLAARSVVAISGYPGDWPELEAAGWLRDERTAYTHPHRFEGRKAVRRTEVLWRNRAEV